MQWCWVTQRAGKTSQREVRENLAEHMLRGLYSTSNGEVLITRTDCAIERAFWLHHGDWISKNVN